ncbi:ABC transporter ATP-binding protein [Natronobiforma cellulositropha]|uniref:ABC transporter ATP-binding protein n=1 Tax=Natronobiforma cellulositropha TaxID=1679076 RepID=UPI0021D58859|nr:ABC transporter ATP-binding protein [Natronobiforma cellulositropha]
MTTPLLEIDDLTVTYRTDAGELTAVSDVSFCVEANEIFGLVGESGSGKSTLAKAIIGCLDRNGRIDSGEIRYCGTALTSLSEERFRREFRWNEIAWIPQGSMNSLDPLERLCDQALEIAQTHTDHSAATVDDRFRRAFDAVGLQPDRVTEYPHQFSGGMKQRAMIALALLLEPSLIIADEPTTALDVIMQDQVFRYLDEIRQRTGVGVLLITHDLSVVMEECANLAVLHSGQLAEVGPVTAIYDAPHHPYTRKLLGAFPDVRDPDAELEVLEGHPPKITDGGGYCTFATRCPIATAECETVAPTPQQALESPSQYHLTTCHRSDRLFEHGRSVRRSR